MMQPGPGMAPPTMGQQPPQQYQQQPPQQQQPYVMMPPQPQAPPPMWAPSAQAPPQQQPQQPASADEVRTLWIGDLQYWMDENYLYTCFAHTGEVTSVKVIRNKQTSQSEGYGFIEFNSRAGAERVLQTYNGAIMPNGGQSFRLNWATFSAGERRHDDSPDYTIFVGDLAADVTDYLLQETFRARYNSVKGAKVVIDRLTGRTKGYGFVRFADESEQVRAMTEMQGVLCSTRPMRIGPASNKTPATQSQPKASYQNSQSQGSQNENDPNNTTIFVGNLDPNVTDDHLRQVFSQYGELVHVKIPAGKRCGFVQFADRSCAEEALNRLNGTVLGGQNVRLSWGRSPANILGTGLNFGAKLFTKDVDVLHLIRIGILSSKLESVEDSPVTPPLNRERLPRNMYRPTGMGMGYSSSDSFDHQSMQSRHFYDSNGMNSTPKVSTISAAKTEISSMDASMRSSSSREADRSGDLSISNASDLETEWVEQDEPGVYITIRALPGGARELKRVRFSREKFGEMHARLWWEENRARIHEQYL